MVNEVLCKIVCHNICCLIQESHELGIGAAFWAESLPAQPTLLCKARAGGREILKADDVSLIRLTHLRRASRPDAG